SFASFNPCLPVHALAFPELTTMTWARPLLRRAIQTFTGAAHTWFVVNMPAAALGTCDRIIAKSRFWPLSEPLPVPNRLMSQNTPLALKPCGATIEPGMVTNLNFIFDF